MTQHTSGFILRTRIGSLFRDPISTYLAQIAMLACLFLALSTMTTSAISSAKSPDAITLRRDVLAVGVAQLRCLGGELCNTSAEPAEMLCRRREQNSEEHEWECNAALPDGVRLGKTDIACGSGGRFASVGVPPASADAAGATDSRRDNGAAPGTNRSGAAVASAAAFGSSRGGGGGKKKGSSSAPSSHHHACRVQYTLSYSAASAKQKQQGAGLFGFFAAYAIFLALNHGLGELLCRWLGIDASKSRCCRLLFRSSADNGQPSPHGSNSGFGNYKRDKHSGKASGKATQYAKVRKALASAMPSDAHTGGSRSSSPEGGGRRSPLSGGGKSSLSPSARKAHGKRH